MSPDSVDATASLLTTVFVFCCVKKCFLRKQKCPAVKILQERQNVKGLICYPEYWKKNLLSSLHDDCFVTRKEYQVKWTTMECPAQVVGLAQGPMVSMDTLAS